jgi:hypothetical protein
VELQGPVLRVGTTDPEQIQPILDTLRTKGLVVRRVQQMRPSLEDLFMEATGAAAQAVAPPKPVEVA